MIKADIVRKVADGLSASGHPIKDKDALEIVDQIIGCLRDVIVRDGRLEVRDFGVFQIKERKARIGRNPKNRKPYPIPSHRVVTFKPGKEIKVVAAPGDSAEADEAST